MAYRPTKTHTDANRNLISNIHSRGLNPQAAAERILNLAAQMTASRISGISIREQLPPALSGSAIKT
jgi:ethanolamine ammonia-lyase small subunit